MAYDMRLSILSAVYHVQVWMIVLHALYLLRNGYCCYQTAYKGYSAAVSTMRELIWGMEWLIICFLASHFLSIMLSDVSHALMCMHRNDYMSLSDSFQRVRLYRSIVKERLMVCSWVSYFLSFIFKCEWEWLWYMRCICIVRLNVVVGQLTKDIRKYQQWWS
jgi:hypothetical protein